MSGPCAITFSTYSIPSFTDLSINFLPGGKIFVCIRDEGCGISQEALPHIFEKFYQGDSSRSTEGNGLGLALVKRIVTLHGGEISAESRQGDGAAFTVALPLAHAAQAA